MRCAPAAAGAARLAVGLLARLAMQALHDGWSNACSWLAVMTHWLLATWAPLQCIRSA